MASYGLLVTVAALHSHCCVLLQNVSNTAWAFGRLGSQQPAMFNALSAAAKATKLEGYNNQNITDLAWGFVEAGNQVGGRACLCQTIV